MAPLPKIALGSQGLEVSCQGYGCMGLTTAYGSRMSDDAIVGMLETVYDNGISFWDTANVYCFVEDGKRICQEEKIAPALSKIGRDKIVIATKTGIKVTSNGPLNCGDPEFVRKECEDSLRRLNVECIDLFYLHRIDRTIPIEVTMMELKKLVDEGKIKYVGLSECSAKTIRRAHKIVPITCVQMEYSLWCRDSEADVLPTCKELGIGLVAYSPLGRGFFGGVHKKTDLEKGDLRGNQERFVDEENVKMYERVEALAATKGCSTPQLALAWVQAQQARACGVLAIPGTTKEKNLKSNIGAASITLSAEELATLEAAVPPGRGARYGKGGAGDTFETDTNPELTPEQAKELGL